MHEVVTLQFGQRSNYVATHFWNAQESYFTYSDQEDSLVDHDVCFRAGIGADGTETFTPRAVVYDLKGGFGSMRQINALYEVVDDQQALQSLWDGPRITEQLPAIPMNPYQRSLEDGSTPPPLSAEKVKYWSDFNRVYYHPKSLVQMSEYELGSSLMPFEDWETGNDLFSSLDREHDLLDRDFRPFAEEADLLQGVSVVTTTDDAWGGFASEYIDRLRDELGKKSIWVYGIQNDERRPQNQQISRQRNLLRSYRQLSTQASVFIPMVQPTPGLPSYVSLEPSSLWSASALLSTAMETATLPSRLKHNRRVTFDTTEGMLNRDGNRNIAKLGFEALKKPVQTNGDTGNHPARDNRMRADGVTVADSHRDNEEINEALCDMDLFPCLQQSAAKGKKIHVFSMSEIRRGRGEQDPKKNDSIGQDIHNRQNLGSPITQSEYYPVEYPLPDSFPKIYQMSGNGSGIDVRAVLACTSAVADWLRDMQGSTRRVTQLDERENLMNWLEETRENYVEGWESQSESEDDL